MASFSGLLELSGPRGHTVRDFPPGVLDAAAQAMPPGLFLPFVEALLVKCSILAAPGPIPLADVLWRTYAVQCPGVSEDHLSAFCRRLWPRHTTLAELEGYTGIVTAGLASLSRMDPRLRQLLDSALAHESEAVRVAVLQHFVDNNILKLILAPRAIEAVLKNKHSMTIPDDPHLHQLLLQLLAAVRAELAQLGDGGGGGGGAPVGGTAPAAFAAAAAAGLHASPALPAEVAPPVGLGQRRCGGGGSSSSEEAWPGTPSGQETGGNKPDAAPFAGAVADLQPAVGGHSPAAAAATCGLRRRRHG